MKVKGTVGAIDMKEPVYEGKDIPPKEGEKNWFEKIPYGKLSIPYCTRPKGRGARIEFYAYSNLPDKALEIKEAAPYKFKHTGDVHRNAHYIGMYMMYQMYVGLTGKRETESKIFQITEDIIKGSQSKVTLREQFLRMFEKYIQGLLPSGAFERGINSFIDTIQDDDTREWFKDDVNRILQEKEFFKDQFDKKSYMREYMKRYRNSQKMPENE